MRLISVTLCRHASCGWQTHASGVASHGVLMLHTNTHDDMTHAGLLEKAIPKAMEPLLTAHVHGGDFDAASLLSSKLERIDFIAHGGCRFVAVLALDLSANGRFPAVFQTDHDDPSLETDQAHFHQKGLESLDKSHDRFLLSTTIVSEFRRGLQQLCVQTF